MTNNSDDSFYNNVINTSSDDSDDDTEILLYMVVALFIHDQEHHEQKFCDRLRVGFWHLNATEWPPCTTMVGLLTWDQSLVQCVVHVKGALLRIMHGVRCYDDYFNLRVDATCKLGFTSYQKMHCGN